jgi:hypothetical protein
VQLTQIKLQFESGETFTAKVLETHAPKTSSFIIEHLPLTTKAIHSIFSGHVILAEANFRFNELENPRVIGIKPGDILFNTHLPAPIRRENGELVPCEILIAYGPLIHPKGSCGDEPVNHFAVIESHLDSLKLVGRRIREKAEKLTISVS